MSGQGEVKKIYKLAQDSTEYWGEVGHGSMKYPVFFCNDLLPPNEISLNERLAQTLRAVDVHRNDVQANGIVHDIIDPSLNARMLPDWEMKDLLFERKNFIEDAWQLVLRTDQLLYHRNQRKDEFHFGFDRERHYWLRHEWDGIQKRWVLDAFLQVPQEHQEEETQDEQQFLRRIENDQSDWVLLPESPEEGLQLVTDVCTPSYAARTRTPETVAAKLVNWYTQSQRGVFQWVPTVVHCAFEAESSKRTATFVGNIAGLPERRFCEDLYADLESVLSQMLPLLAKVPFYDDAQHREKSAPHEALRNGNIQVVVKAQRYVIPARSSYSGRWHKEGFSENIVAGGVYYVDADDTSGGALSFRPVETPDQWNFPYRRIETDSDDSNKSEEQQGLEEGSEDEGGDQWWTHYIRDIQVKTGTAAVFANTVPHRFRTIRNDTDEPQERLFVNFFFVDPDKPLPMTTSTNPSRSLLRCILSRNGLTDSQVQQAVMDFVEGYDCADPIHRKVVRDRARTAMAANRPRWMCLDYGNAGSIRYHDNSVPPLGDWNWPGVAEHSECNTSELGSGL